MKQFFKTEKDKKRRLAKNAKYAEENRDRTRNERIWGRIKVATEKIIQEESEESELKISDQEREVLEVNMKQQALFKAWEGHTPAAPKYGLCFRSWHSEQYRKVVTELLLKCLCVSIKGTFDDLNETASEQDVDVDSIPDWMKTG